MKFELFGQKQQNASAPLLCAIWIARVVIGATFIVSGFVKSVDVWGTVFKFEEYFTIWGWEMPLSLTVMGAILLCSVEFIIGMMLVLGCYRRAVVWCMLAFMALMLPLTGYIWLEDPVSDCGCFGDFLVLSNGATFAKNIFITLVLLWLVKYNRRAGCLFDPYIQWICAVACAVFINAVELYGFNVQPMIDFRSFPVGTSLLADERDDGSEDDFVFVYEKDGVKKDFTVDNLPDSSWTFVDRRSVGGDTNEDNLTELSVFDSDGENVTADVISPEGPELLVIVPQLDRADLYYSSYINELNDIMQAVGGSLVELSDGAASGAETEEVRELAQYPSYNAESTVLKEFSRGLVSLVMLRDGKIEWKRNLSSVNVESVLEASDRFSALESLKPEGRRLLLILSNSLLGFLFVLFAFNRLFAVFGKRKRRDVEKNSLNLHNKTL